MKARDISGKPPGGKRTILASILPLETPFVVQIFPIYACNFKCTYCIFSQDKSKHGFISEKVIMNFELYKKCIDDMLSFPHKVKVLRFVGIGEPLLHPNIAEMVGYAVKNGIANTVELLTNASLLTPKMSDALISAGLTRLVVSLQGTTREMYRKICAVDIDFNKLVENLRYFYNNKSNTHVYIKIIDCTLEEETDKNRFYEIFGDICDTIAVEHAVPIHQCIEYSHILKKRVNTFNFTQFGLTVVDVQICPQPFFTMQINPDGKIVPCYAWEYPDIMGDSNVESIISIWNGIQFQTFRRKMLSGVKQSGEVCARCKIFKYRIFPEDILDNDVERLKKIYEV